MSNSAAFVVDAVGCGVAGGGVGFQGTRGS